jgi:hypothetical protein
MGAWPTGQQVKKLVANMGEMPKMGKKRGKRGKNFWGNE